MKTTKTITAEELTSTLSLVETEWKILVPQVSDSGSEQMYVKKCLEILKFAHQTRTPKKYIGSVKNLFEVSGIYIPKSYWFVILHGEGYTLTVPQVKSACDVDVNISSKFFYPILNQKDIEKHLHSDFGVPRSLWDELKELTSICRAERLRAFKKTKQNRTSG